MTKYLITALLIIIMVCIPTTVFAEEPELSGVMVPSGLTAEQLEVGLLHDLKKYSQCFIDAEEETGINAIFLASLAASEGGWKCSQSALNNIMGWTGSNGYMSFNSIEECIEYCSAAIKKLYLTPDGAYFNGYEIEDICIMYNGRQYWIDLVYDVYAGIENRIELTEEAG